MMKLCSQTCNITQLGEEGRVRKVPLQSIPLKDKSFKRVAVDLIGPMFRGN